VELYLPHIFLEFFLILVFAKRWRNETFIDKKQMTIFRYKKDQNLYTLYEQLRPFYNLVAVPYFPNQGVLAKSKRSISMNDFEVVAER
jgi:hypothetical protein